MLFTLFKNVNQNQPQLREFDPTTLQRLKEGSYLVKLISEAEVAGRKCEFYSGICNDQEVAKFFKEEAEMLRKAKNTLQEYYESMTRE
ncbi:hypothetical protein [Zhaonella formicivorans]|jgi:rubrerythrin|uniref:hypothetical protein n=1 Tax=Zhaonella formicivorans TaxID=2528593 RepID=UPI0010DB72D6|nr:hypothetical protein [Zhaonella formicivorans]